MLIEGKSSDSLPDRYHLYRQMISYLIDERHLLFEQVLARSREEASEEEETRAWIRGRKIRAAGSLNIRKIRIIGAKPNVAAVTTITIIRASHTNLLKTKRYIRSAKTSHYTDFSQGMPLCVCAAVWCLIGF